MRLLSEAALQTDKEVGMKLRRKGWGQNIVLGIVKMVVKAIGIDEATQGH